MEKEEIVANELNNHSNVHIEYLYLNQATFKHDLIDMQNRVNAVLKEKSLYLVNIKIVHSGNHLIHYYILSEKPNSKIELVQPDLFGKVDLNYKI